MIKSPLIYSPYFNALVSGERLSTQEKVFLELLRVIRPLFVPGHKALGAKSRVPNNQNASYMHRAREVARYLVNRGHIGIRDFASSILLFKKINEHVSAFLYFCEWH